MMCMEFQKSLPFPVACAVFSSAGHESALFNKSKMDYWFSSAAQKLGQHGSWDPLAGV